MTLKESFLFLIDHLQNRGELMKAYIVARNMPSELDGDEEAIQVVVDTKKRLEDITEVQRYGTVGGKVNSGFVDPEDKEKIVKYRLLKEFVKKHSLKKLVDVGCFTGWVGRGLSVEGIEVHGIDIHPVIIQIAAFAAAGSLATFEYLPVQKLGYTHPREYDGCIAFDILEHVFDIDIALESCERSLKKGGWMIINLPSTKGESMANVHPLEDHEHLYSYSEQRVKELFDKKEDVLIQNVINEGGSPNWFITYRI